VHAARGGGVCAKLHQTGCAKKSQPRNLKSMPPLIASIHPPDGVRSVRANRKGHNLTMYSAKPAFSGGGHRRATILKSHESNNYTKNANYSGIANGSSSSPANSPAHALGSRNLANAVRSRLGPGQLSDTSTSPTRRSPPAPQVGQEPILVRAPPGEPTEVAPRTEPIATVPGTKICWSRSTEPHAKIDQNATMLDPSRDSRRSFDGSSQCEPAVARKPKRMGTAPANLAKDKDGRDGELKWSHESTATATTADTGEKSLTSSPRPHHPVDTPRRFAKRMETTFRGPDGEDRIAPDDWSKLVERHDRTIHKDEYLETLAHRMEQSEHPYQEQDYSPPRNQIAEDRLAYDSKLVQHVHHTDIEAVRVDSTLTNRMKTAPDLYSYGRQLDDMNRSQHKKRPPYDPDQNNRGRQLDETNSGWLQKRQPQEPDQNNSGQLEDTPSSPIQSINQQPSFKKRPPFKSNQKNGVQVENAMSSSLKKGAKSTTDLQDSRRLEVEKTSPLQSTKPEPSMKIRPKSTVDLHDIRRLADDGQYSDPGSGRLTRQAGLAIHANLNSTGSRPGTPTQTKRRSRELPVSNAAFTDRSLRMKEGTHARNGVLSHGPGINDDRCHPQGFNYNACRPGENRTAGQVSHRVQDHRFPHCAGQNVHMKVIDGCSSVPVPHSARGPAAERYGRQAACNTDIMNSGEVSIGNQASAEAFFGKEMGRKARNAFANQDYATAAGNAPIKDEHMPTHRGGIGQGPADDAHQHITPSLTESPMPLAAISVAARSKERERLRAEGCFKDGFTDFVHKQAVHNNPRSHRFAWKHELRSKSVPPDRDVTRNPVTFDRVLPKEDVYGVRHRENPGPIQAGNPARRPTVVVPGRSYGQTSPRHQPGTDSIQMWKAVTYEGFHSTPAERNHRLAQDTHFSNLCKHTEAHNKTQVSEMAAIREKSIYVTSPRLTEFMQWG